MKPTLLIIDDDQQFIQDFLLILEDEYDCTTASTGKEGIQKCQQTNPDVVLLDLMLGDGTNGLDILKQLRKIDDSLPIIMITDYGSIDTAIESIRLGAFDYISKTPNMDKLKILI